LAGVINFKSAPFVPNGTFQGNWLSEYHANNGYIGNSIHLGGNKGGFAYDLRARRSLREGAKDFITAPGGRWPPLFLLSASAASGARASATNKNPSRAGVQ
jgi:hypothetical protein